MRGLVLVFLLSALSAPSASACGILEPDEQRRREREDIELQANLVKEVASEAEDVFVGTVASVDEASRSARIKVQRVVKGAVDQELLLDLSGLDGLVVACWPSREFRNTNVLPQRTYVFYVAGPKLLRAGWTERGSADISLRRELKLIRKAAGT
jgi:hypothetical protein